MKQEKVVKQITEENILKQAKKSIQNLFQNIPFFKIKRIKKNSKTKDRAIDLTLDVIISGKIETFIVIVKKNGEPRFVRNAILQLINYLQKTNDAYGIFMAPYISENSKLLCKEEGIGCIDFAGNAYISYTNIIIDRSGQPNPLKTKRIVKSVFSPKSSRILRVLLAEPSKKWFVEKMAKEAGISIGLVSKVKQALLAEEWIIETGKKFSLIKPDEVLEQWVTNYTYRKNIINDFFTGLSEEQLEKRIKSECVKRDIKYGLALFTGAKKVAPFVKFLRSFFYIEDDIEAIADGLNLKKVDSGANVSLILGYDDGIYYNLQDINGINVVSDIQLYLDLKNYKGRGEEAAEAIFNQRIKTKW